MPLPSFKDTIKADTETVFLSGEEFADVHIINGKPMPCLIDNNELLERKQGGGGTDRKDGIFSADLLLYVKASDYGARPRPGTTVTVDQKTFMATDCIDEAGIYSITLEATRTW